MHDDGFEWVTSNHRLEDNEDERKRVVECGGHVARASVQGCARGPQRAWPGGVACARGIGDADCGEYISAAPAFATRKYPVNGAALVICSDGVWDALPPVAVARAVRAARSAQRAAEAVTHRVSTKYNGALLDDVTCSVAYLGSPPWLERSSGSFKSWVSGLSRGSSGLPSPMRSMRRNRSKNSSLASYSGSESSLVSFSDSFSTFAEMSPESPTGAVLTSSAATSRPPSPPAIDVADENDVQPEWTRVSLRRSSSAPHLDRLSERSEHFSDGDDSTDLSTMDDM